MSSGFFSRIFLSPGECVVVEVDENWPERASSRLWALILSFLCTTVAWLKLIEQGSSRWDGLTKVQIRRGGSTVSPIDEANILLKASYEKDISSYISYLEKMPRYLQP